MARLAAASRSSRSSTLTSIPSCADHVFDSSVSTKAVFDRIAKSLVRSVLHGYNGTIFAYG